MKIVEESIKKFECSAVDLGVEIEFTNICGLDCIGCVRKDFPHFGFLQKKELKNILDFIKEKGYKQIVISGLGDAFLHPEFYLFIDIIFSVYPDICVYIMTKGQTITYSDIDKILDYKQQGYDLNITYSIFSLEEKQYFYVTGGGKLNNLLEMIKYSYKKKIHFNFEFFLDLHTVKYISLYKKFCKLFGKSFHYTIPHNWGGDLDLGEYGNIFHSKLLTSYIQKREKNELCEAFSSDFLFFDYKGDVYKCGLQRKGKKLFLGSTNKNTIDDIFHNMSKLEYVDICQTCSYFKYKTKTG